jgi:hypothetical protein
MEAFLDDLIDNFRKDERVVAMGQLAREFKFRFKERAKFASQPYHLKGFEIFRGKKPSRLKGILSLQDPSFNGKIRIYDYVYFGEFKKRRTTIFELESKDFDLPKFEIHPKGTLNQIQEFFVGKEKPYPEIKEFHSKYEVKTLEEEYFENRVSYLALEQIAEKKGLYVEGEGDYLLMYYRSQQVDVRDIIADCDYALDLAENVLHTDSGDYV